tara:strand:- start:72 stop:308 length:237 start_codon:yes stop_codon:yes gene_type:complete
MVVGVRAVVHEEEEEEEEEENEGDRSSSTRDTSDSWRRCVSSYLYCFTMNLIDTEHHIHDNVRLSRDEAPDTLHSRSA